MKKTADIVIENSGFKLVVGGNAIVKSLLHKATGEECLRKGARLPLSTITEPRPYQNEVKLAYPNRRTTFKANAVRMEEGRLVISYELIPWEATISIRSCDDYIAFTLESLDLSEPYGIDMDEPPISEMWFLRLPLRERGHWGDWLNVVWDEKVAVALVAAEPSANADSDELPGGRILQAGSDINVRLCGVTAALVVSSTTRLLDRIATIEEDYDLPRGVASRRHKLYNASYYMTAEITPRTVDKFIAYAKKGGFRLMSIYYPSFLRNEGGYSMIGNYDQYKYDYPNGKADLKKMLAKIKKAGITPGCHFLHSHIGRKSRYVTPVPDHRLNLLRIFTLSRPLGKGDTTIYVEENPIHATMTECRRLLKIGTELVTYEGYTTEAPYKFYGCKRGSDNTSSAAQPRGFMFGLLDVSEFGRGTSIYLNQYSSLQDEVADMIADIWEAGFEFFYFDGSEGVNPPFWFHVANAQHRVFRKLNPQPILAEGAARTHFSWHMLTGGNAFDVFRPEIIRQETIRHPLREAPRMRDNFTRLNFGWLGYFLPGDATIGTQPDQIEFVTSKAAAWDCPVSLSGNLERFETHPRTDDIFEVFRRWEEVRATNWLTAAQKEALRDPQQEYILLVNEQQKFELQPYDRIEGVAGGSREVLAFVFERRRSLYIVYNHISADKWLELPINPRGIQVLEELAEAEPASAGREKDKTLVPLGRRRYLKVSPTRRDEILAALKAAQIRHEVR